MADKCLDPQTEESFAHKSGDSSFLARVDSVFSALGALERKHEENLSEIDVNKDSVEIKVDEVGEDSQSVGLQEDLGLPESALPSEVRGGDDKHSSKTLQCTRPLHGARSKRRRPPWVPDHVLHPEKWKKYSLEDDGTEKIGLKGDALNKSIALEFLRELKGRKDKESTSAVCSEETNYSALHDFRSSKLSSEKHSDNTQDSCQGNAAKTANTSFVGTTLQMPMYEIGMKETQYRNQGSKIKQSTTMTPGQATELSLSHLTPQDILDIEQDSAKSEIRGLEGSGANVDSESYIQDCKQAEDSLVTFKSKKKDRSALRKRADEAEDGE